MKLRNTTEYPSGLDEDVMLEGATENKVKKEAELHTADKGDSTCFTCGHWKDYNRSGYTTSICHKLTELAGTRVETKSNEVCKYYMKAGERK